MHRAGWPGPQRDRPGSRCAAAVLACWVFGASLAFAAGESPPEDLEALPHASGQIRVTWTDVTGDGGEDGFVLERMTETSDWTQIADTNDLEPDRTWFVDAVGPTREKYTYRVASSHGGSLSPWSNTSAALPVFTDMPLYGWLDAAAYDNSCVIDGVVDPHPLQCAIQDVRGRVGPGENSSVGPHVLYFPDGVYEVDQTLFLEGRAGIQFVGESPGGVVLKWMGGPGSGPDDTNAMFHAEGNRDSTWRNLVWDGNCGDPDNCFVVAFDQSFCGRSDTSILRSQECGPDNLGWPESATVGESDIGGAHIDSVFKNAFVGLRLGRYGVADDTTAFRRCQFIDDFVGVSLEDPNALNHALWDSLFQGNFVGISNDFAAVRKEYDPAYSPGACVGQSGEPACFYNSDCDTNISCAWTRRRAGDFDIRRGRFIGNAHTDIWADPTGDFTIRDSWATGSGRFFFGAGFNATPGRYSLINNTVWDDQGLAIETRTPGTFLFADNQIYTDPDATQAPVILNSLIGYNHPDSGKIDLIAVDNVYSTPDPYDFRQAFRLRQFGDQVTSTPPPVSIPPLPTAQESLNGRPVYTVTDATTPDAAANAARIQRVIDAALADPQPAIVHLPGIAGRYEINQTLQIPAGADLILTGDGKFTMLSWVGTPGDPILKIDAAQVDGLTIRDLGFLSGGIVVENLSQDNAHAFVNQLRVAQSSAAGIVVEDLDTVKLNFLSYAGEHGLFVGSESVGMLVKAGPLPVAAQDKPGVAVLSGTSLTHKWDFLVLNDQAGAKVLISGNYMEASRHYLGLRGDGADGAVTIHGSKMAPIVLLDVPSDPVELAEKTAVISVEDFPGNLSVVETQMFIVPPTAGGGSTQEAVDHGARVRVVGSQAADLDIQVLGTSLRRQPSAGNPGDPAQDEPECDLSEALPNTVDFLRLSGKRSIPSAFPLADIHVDEVDPDNLIPVSTLTLEQEGQLFAGLELLRTMPAPAFYDEAGASDPAQINFDRVFIFKASPVGLVLSGGIPCAGPGDCVDAVPCTADSCDLTDLPANIPGQCRFVPDDLQCDDADACTADSCDPLNGCSNDPLTCDDGLFCNGVETCDPAGGCQPGVAVECGDSVACTTDSCNDTTDECDHLPDDGLCDNGVFCDGAETCDIVAGCQTGGDPCPGQICNESADSCEISSAPRLETGTVAVGGTHVTVQLINAYANPVVVCSVQYDANTVPVVARVGNVTSTSFEVRLQTASSGTVEVDNVNYLVVEEGAWTIDSLKIEAQAYSSSVTDENDSWIGEAQTYLQSYSAPVVLGQVMSENDPDWSVFWCQGNSRTSPPSSTALRTGKTVCEDPDTTRANETIGVIVLETGAGTVAGVAYEAALGADTIRGATQNPPHDYTFTTGFSAPPAVAVVTMAAMDGNNGGWAQTHGAVQATETALFLSIDEDQVADSERSHTTEQVGYAVFETGFSFEEAAGCSVPADCDDGVFCNGVEECVAGVCQVGTPIDCDDGVGCTTDSCNEATGNCDNTPVDTACDDGAFCNGAEICDAVNDCQAGSAVVCDDSVSCTTDECNETSDSCDNIPVDTACDDGIFCNGTESCDPVNGCEAGNAIDCDDGVGCTIDACDEALDSCDHTPDDGACDDGLFCDGVETCDAANDCQAGSEACPGQFCDEATDACANCVVNGDCDDGIFCNGAETCAAGSCVAGNAIDCSDGVDCTADSCNETSDSCDHTPVDANCDDGNFCNGAETCDAVSDCAAGNAIDCDDGVECTTDSCNETSNSCDNAPVDSACDDGAFCNGVETCDAVNDCQAGSEACPDQFCDEATDTCSDCVADADCDDGLFCNGSEACDTGTCVAGTAVGCDDGVSCTTDSCNETSDGCDNTPVDANCDDGLYCNGAEICDAVSDCQAGSAVVCDDSVSCTTDECNETSDSCDNIPVDANCGDGIFCNGAETCDAVSDCQAGGEACPGQFCDEETDACVNCAVDADCDDGLFCNGSEACDTGTCVAGTTVGCDDGVSCTTDSCNETSDGCDNTPVDANCDDGLYCNGAEICDAVSDCQAGSAVVCDDNVSCTTDECNETSDSCDNIPVDTACDDGNFCNGAETCDAVSDCAAGNAIDCDDGVECTTDSCNETSNSCDNAPVDSACDDGAFCNGVETCDAVNDCQAGSEACPDQFCDEATDTCSDCVVNGDCDDGIFCNGAETCAAGACVAGNAIDCSDGVDCTADSCNETSDSCDHTPVDAICDDGNFCNGAETCDAVSDCAAGNAIDCDDGVDCTIDVCNEASASCDHAPDDSACDNGQFCDGAETCSALDDCQPGADPCPGQTCDEPGDSCGSGPVAQLEAGTLTEVGSQPVTVYLQHSYVSPVVVCSVQYSNNTTPVVARVSQVTANSFDVRLQNPSDGAVADESVSYIVVEEGVWTVGDLTIEAQTYTSTVTDQDSSWVGEPQAYGGSYSSPVVLGQVMTENDLGWSAFWCRGGSRSKPPSSSSLTTGKTVCEDSDVTRVNETIGIIVVEAGAGTIGGIAFDAALGADTIKGVDDSPPYTYSFGSAFSSDPTIAIITMAAVDGVNGCWAQTHGSTLATPTSLFLSIDEDQLKDSERKHTNEQVGYLVFESDLVYP